MPTKKKTSPVSLKKLQVLEAILVLENGIISEKKLLDCLKISSEELEALVDAKNKMFFETKSVINIKKKGSDYELFIHNKFSDLKLNTYKSQKKLMTNSLLEVLSIIVYNQPITKAEIEDIRAVNCTSYLKILLEEKLIFISGKKKTPGLPSLFKTTDKFLKQFGINSLNDLPPLEDVKTYPFLD